MAFNQDENMVEFNHLFNFDQATRPSRAQAQKGKTVVSPNFTVPGPENAYIAPQQPTFQGPSHQYELFKQHASLPPGAYSLQQQTGQIPSQNYGLGPGMPQFDMGDSDAGFGGMDMDFQDVFDGSSMNGFVDPSTVGNGSDIGDASPVAQPVQRLWPGMHQQHAAAKEQQKKLEQQKVQEQQRKILLKQQQLATQPQGSHQRKPSQNRNKPSDPVVEERISQILRSMRESNAQRQPSATPQPTTAQPSKMKKDEDDMDEDERLLASEEGKKLSSKERRQLRNKVSARAFRSRRKEYIGQLEGELNGKTTEADNLRAENDALRAENSQLTDLARMLLGHPAFNNVLEDLAARGASMPSLPPQAGQQRGSIQHTSQLSMNQSVAPQQPSSNAMDFSTPMDSWNGGAGGADFNFNPNVFAVTELPEPVFESSVLSGKISEPSTLTELPSLAKTDYPTIDRPAPKAEYPTVESACNAHEDDLYAAPTTAIPNTASSLPTEDTIAEIVNRLPIQKCDSSSIELISIEQAEDEERALAARFTALCDRLDSAAMRIESMISRQ